MAQAIIVPVDLWEDDDAEGVITAWLIDDNSEVQSEQLVADVMVEKIQYEIHSPFTGKISITCHEEEVVTKGCTIAEVS
ncbi:hypothetical protein GCM10007978_31930 [Shewanella hanedai]|uniref:Biotin attachment protein n=1 Tax=Shewanella hanedai TaxID=25 RepID=A0A553JKB9_SHEHA|nr:biotin/lipoyl-containing protein [Shewanella hanedai]TRY12893.1 biotin attachment protein [Shewanella hanedai]GGI92016.1 hypothetical protein GCM10007978_31930 [Shewanella hanedai]